MLLSLLLSSVFYHFSNVPPVRFPYISDKAASPWAGPRTLVQGPSQPCPLEPHTWYRNVTLLRGPETDRSLFYSL